MRKLIVVLALSVPLFAQAAEIAGRVVDASGAPIPKATIHVYEARPRTGVSSVCPSCYRDCGKKEPSAQNGEFRIANVDDELVFRLLAIADGYEPAFAAKVDPRNGAVSIAMQKRVSDGRLVRGRVVDPDGKIVVGATVTPQAVHQKGRTGYGKIPGVDPLSVTNERGEFVLRVPPETTLDVRVKARNFAAKIEEKVAPDDLRTIRLGLGTTVVGRLEKDGKPLAGVPVGFAQKSRLSATFMGIDEIGTDEEGRFVMTALPPGYEYFVYPKSVAAEAKLVCTATEGASIDAGTFRVTRGHLISGRVAGGAKDLEVVLAREHGAEARTTRTDDTGRFVFSNVPGEPVVVFARGMAEVHLVPDGAIIGGGRR